MDDAPPPDDEYGSAGQGPAGSGNPHRPDGNGGGQRGMRIDPGAGGDYPLDKMTRGGGSGRRRAAQMSVHDTAGRLPPQALDVEQSVLGALMIDKDAINRALEVLPDDPFYDGRHQRIYAAVRALSERSDPIDLITLTQELRRRGDLDGAGGAAYLSELTGKVASAANVEYHARIIAERSLLRSFIETATLLVGKAYDPTTDAFELLDEAEKDIFAISNLKKTNSARPLGDVVMDTMKRLESISGTEGGLTGVPSAIRALDQLTAGWQPSDLIIVAARPSMGKTAFSLAVARNAALHPQRPSGVAYFSLEMSSDQLAQRLLTSEARVDAQVARTGRMNDMEWQQVARAAARLHKAPIFIDDTPGLGILELRAKCRRLKAEHDIGLIVVDYLQLMHGSGSTKGGNREQEIAQISRSLKGLAKDLAVPVIALSQLSRAVENRPDKRPQLSDLRESGSIEQDADLVIFLHRPEKYGITTDDAGQSTEGIAEIIIGKQRNGPLGTAVAAFVKEYARFENLTTYYDGAGGYGNEPDDPFAADGGSGGSLGAGASGLLPPGDDLGYGGGGFGGEDLPGGYGPPPGGFGDGSSMPPPFPPSDPGDAPF